MENVAMKVDKRSWGLVVWFSPDEYVQAQWHTRFQCTMIEYVRHGRVNVYRCSHLDRTPYTIVDLLKEILREHR